MTLPSSHRIRNSRAGGYWRFEVEHATSRLRKAPHIIESWPVSGEEFFWNLNASERKTHDLRRSSHNLHLKVNKITWFDKISKDNGYFDESFHKKYKSFIENMPHIASINEEKLRESAISCPFCCWIVCSYISFIWTWNILLTQFPASNENTHSKILICWAENLSFSVAFYLF